jgi:hypothetical protein
MVAAKERKDVTGLANEVLSYFLRNPEAVDTLEGVTRWRLLEQRIHNHLQETSEALDWLVKRDFLRKMDSPSTESCYGLNVENRPKAEEFIRKIQKQSKHAPRKGLKARNV